MVTRPRFLVPTQPVSSFRGNALARAEQEFEEKPGIALELPGAMAALLDGHHRALAAARAGRPFSCLTISPYYPADWNKRDSELKVPRNLRKLVSEGHREIQYANDRIDEKASAEFCHQLEIAAPGELPNGVAPGDLSSVFPSFDQVIANWQVATNGETISDEDIEDVLSRRRRLDSHGLPWDAGRILLQALELSSHPKTLETAIRIIRDHEWVASWEHACQTLARHRCEAVDDLFVEMLVGDMIRTWPQLKQIIDEYFRECAAPES